MIPTETQQHEQQNRVPINLRREQNVEAQHNNIPLLINQQNEQQIHVPGEEMAQLINNHLPAAGHDVQPPIAPPAAPAETVAEPKNKKERNLQKRRQQEAQQRAREEEALRQAEEKQRMQREREEAQRQLEENRLEQRKIIFSDDDLLKLISAFAQENDTEKAIEKAQVFLKAATKKLLSSDESLSDVFNVTVDYANKLIPPFRLLIATQIEDRNTSDNLLEKTKEHQTKFEELAQERPIISALNQLMCDVLKEEFAASDLMQQAVDRLTEDYDTRMNEQTKLWRQFEIDVAKNLHMLQENEEKPINVFSSESPFHYLTKKTTIEKFRTQTEQLMEQDESLTREAAEQQVFAQHRKELQENAERQTLNGSVVSNVSAEDWKKHGGASFHHVLPAAQAYAIVEKSDGFLYAKPAGNGLCELRPTLPETVQIDGETIPLRRVYNLYIKAIMHKIFDDNGDLREDVKAEKEVIGALSNAKDIEFFFTKIGLASSTDAEIVDNLNNFFRKTLTEMMNGDNAQVDQTLHHLFKLFKASTDYSFLPSEIMGDLFNAVKRIKATGANSSAGQRFEKVRQKMVEEGSSPDEIEAVMRQLVNPDLVEHIYEMREEFIKQNGGAPLTKEQEDQIAAEYSMYADMDMAVKEMMAIRNMNPDSLDVPLPNACSANGELIRGIKRNYMQKQNDILTYRTQKHLYAHPLDYIDYYITHIDELESNNDDKQATLNNLHAMAERIRNGEDLNSPEGKTDIIILKKCADKYAKYKYHVAANLGAIDDNTIITSEGFAAETKQYMVSPFSRNHAVGIYHGKQSYEPTKSEYDFVSEGMIEYYNHDNPLPGEEEIHLVKASIKWHELAKKF